MLAAGGVVVPPAGYFPAIQEVLRRYDVLLIADEVVTGFGRLGQPFGTQVLGLEPDLITVAKGMTSAYVPLSGVLVSEKVWRVLVDGTGTGAFGHGYTYTSHPIAAAAAMANLDLIEREGLVAQAGIRGAYLQERLREAVADHPLVGEVRGLGLMAAVEFVASKDPLRAFDPGLKVGARVTRACLERGVITRALPAADTISFAPPFVITRAGDRYDRRCRPGGHGPGRRRAPARDLTDAHRRQSAFQARADRQPDRRTRRTRRAEGHGWSQMCSAGRSRWARPRALPPAQTAPSRASRPRARRCTSLPPPDRWGPTSRPPGASSRRSSASLGRRRAAATRAVRRARWNARASTCCSSRAATGPRATSSTPSGTACPCSASRAA